MLSAKLVNSLVRRERERQKSHTATSPSEAQPRAKTPIEPRCSPSAASPTNGATITPVNATARRAIEAIVPRPPNRSMDAQAHCSIRKCSFSPAPLQLSNIVMELLVVSINRLSRRRLYRLGETRFRLET